MVWFEISDFHFFQTKLYPTTEFNFFLQIRTNLQADTKEIVNSLPE